MEAVQTSHFGRAQALASICETEMKKAELSKNEIAAQQAAGKGWLAVQAALRGLLAAKGIEAKEFPRSERGRLFMLAKYGSKKLRKNYAHAYAELHQNAYYEAIIIFTVLWESIESMRDFLAEARNLSTSA